MEVRIGDLKPNPFRNLKKYPLDTEKIRILKGSIERNDFWDNVVVRKNGNGVELAYGHHRIEAAKEVLGKNKKVNVIVKNLTDEQMLKVMAADNDDAYRMSPSFVRETVEAALQLLNITSDSWGPRAPDEGRTREKIAEFLGWPERRVQDALAQINAANQGIVSLEALDILPSLRSARAFTAAIKTHPLSSRKQVSIAKKLAQEEETITRDAVLDAIDPESKNQRERDRMDYWKFGRFLTDATAKAETLSSMLQHIAKEKQLLGDPEYKGQAKIFWNACSKVFKAIQDIYKGGGIYEKNQTTKALLE